MKSVFAMLAIVQLVIASPVQAAADTGLTFHDQGQRGPQFGGFGTQATMTIKLGSNSVVSPSERLMLSAHAGPSVARSNFRGVETGRIAALTWSPAYRASFKLAGQDLYTYKTRLGAAEDEQNDGNKPEKKQGAGDKLAWVAVVAGGVMLALIGAFVVHCTSNNGNNCSD